jgi:hypothetical protein
LRLERRSSADRRAVFVGAKAYGQAGGSVIRELFDAEGDGFFADAELLNRLAREKLQRHADKVADEGWRWVLAEPEFDHQASAAMRRVFAKPVPLSKAERRRLHKVQALFDARWHWKRWLEPDHRCLVPFTSFSEYDTNDCRKVPVWFAADDSRPLLCFNGSHSTPRCRVNALPRVNAHRSWPAARFAFVRG